MNRVRLTIIAASLSTLAAGCAGPSIGLPFRLRWERAESSASAGPNGDSTARDDGERTSASASRSENSSETARRVETRDAEETAAQEERIRRQLLELSVDPEFRKRLNLPENERVSSSDDATERPASRSIDEPFRDSSIVRTGHLQDVPPDRSSETSESPAAPPQPPRSPSARIADPPVAAAMSGSIVGDDAVERRSAPPAPSSPLAPDPPATVGTLLPATGAPPDSTSSAPRPESESGSSVTPPPGSSDSGDSATAPAETETESWIAEARQAHDALERMLARESESLSDDERNRLEIRRRMLALVLGDRDEAVETIDSLDEPQKEFWKEQAFGLFHLIEPEDLDLDASFRFENQRRIAIGVDHLRRAEQALASTASLRVHSIALCDQVNSYGNFREFPHRRFAKGEQVIAYCEVENFRAERVVDGEQGDLYESEFRPSIVIFDGTRKAVAQQDFDPIVDRSRRIRRDFYLHFVYTMPSDLPPGKYKLAVMLEDLKAQKSAISTMLDIDLR